MRIYCVRIGNKYGQQYEDYINEKLSDYEVIWIKEPIRPNIPLQWNKMAAMNDDSDEPVLVLDIDKLFINDYKEVIEYPIQHGEFLCAPYWWGNGKIKMSGGFYKFYPSDCKYIYDHFMKDKKWNTSYYIKNTLKTGLVNGNFINLPYFNKSERKAINPDGTEMSFDTFLNCIYLNKATSEQLKEIQSNIIKLKRAGVDEEFKDRQPGLEIITKKKTRDRQREVYIFLETLFLW